MRKRWLIRIVFMLPILLCIAGWAWSYARSDGLQYGGGRRRFAIGADNGSFGAQLVDMPPGVTPEPGWHFVHDDLAPAERHILLHGQVDDYRYFLGWGYNHRTGAAVPSELWEVLLPYYLPLALFSLLLLFVWRKTRPRAGGAFPVEMTKA